MPGQGHHYRQASAARCPISRQTGVIRSCLTWVAVRTEGCGPHGGWGRLSSGANLVPSAGG